MPSQKNSVLKKIKRLSQGYSLRRRQNSNLLKQSTLSNADSTPSALEQRPATPAEKPSLRIKTHIRIVNLVDVDTVTETFKVHLAVFHEWVAPQSESRAVLEEGCDRMDVSWKPEWHPSFEIVGAMSSSSSSEFYSIKVADWYCVHWRCDIKTEITDSMDLEEFPFDVEDLTIQYRLRHATHEAVIVRFQEYETHEAAVGRFQDTEKPAQSSVSNAQAPRSTSIISGEAATAEASLAARPTTKTKKKDQGAALRRLCGSLSLVDLSHANVTLPEYILFSPAPFCWLAEDVEYFGRTCSTVSIQLNFERSYLFYLLNIITIEFALLCVCLGAWALESEHGGRMTFDLIVLLTAINFRSLVADKLPEIGYITIMDCYILVVFFFKLAAFAFHAAQAWLPALASPAVDRTSAVVYISSVFAVHLVFALVVVRKRRARRAEIFSQCAAARQNNALFTAKQKEMANEAGFVLSGDAGKRDRPTSEDSGFDVWSGIEAGIDRGVDIQELSGPFIF
mmetsp:Transcript_55507/g.110026  ORF Transcript_55507/g.110026 Transcript_55507/m.110026 type:complete len:509 (+) Transcript_55507:3-1529(+)